MFLGCLRWMLFRFLHEPINTGPWIGTAPISVSELFLPGNRESSKTGEAQAT